MDQVSCQDLHVLHRAQAVSSLPLGFTLIKQDEYLTLSESENGAEGPTDRINVSPPEMVLVAVLFSLSLFFLSPPTTHLGGKKKKKRGKGAYRHGLAHSQSGQIFLRKAELS